MPELRQNLVTKEWVIIASERAMRPQDLKAGSPALAGKDPDPRCPFCPGNEGESKTLFTLGDKKDWRLRCVQNKHPALAANAPRLEPAGDLYRRLPGEGTHEIIIESPSHTKTLADLTHEQFEDVVAVYQERFRASQANMKVALTLLFKNHGRASGTTLAHPHSQLVGSSVVPSHIRHRMDEAQKHYEQNAECVVCRMNEEEKKQGRRLLADTQYFSAYILFAALSPFHLWVVPKRHTPSFSDITASEADDLSTVLQTVLRKLGKGLGNPDYSFVIQSTPQDRGVTEAFHWYLSLVVRLGHTAGFELGSGMFINNVVPEDAAKFLNAIKL